MIQVYNYNNKLYFIEKNLHEINNDFYERCWFIINYINNNSDDDINYEYVVNLSNIHINKKKYGCEYKD